MPDGKTQFDVAVIGGGPAGMMAAGTAAANGAKVVLVEKNPSLGQKLLLTGKGRCNLTTAESDPRKFIGAIFDNGAFLFSALNAFGTAQTIDFFESRGLETKVERGQRIFPLSDRSSDVAGTLAKYLESGKVTILRNTAVKRIVAKSGSIERIETAGGSLTAKNYIVATGGLSYPQTGCTGDGYAWGKMLGHSLIATRPGLVPIRIKENFIRRLEGLSLKNVAISLWHNDRKKAELFGEALFTGDGLSGPVVLNLSVAAGRLLSSGGVSLRINFKPALDRLTLDQRLKRDIDRSPRMAYKNFLADLLPKKMIPVFVSLSEISPMQPVGQLTKVQRSAIIKLLTEFRLTVDNLAGYDKAIITLGGIDPREIDPKSMRSKIISNLYLAGEIIDVHGPTGGYNLQICFATGYLAGKNASQSK